MIRSSQEQSRYIASPASFDPVRVSRVSQELASSDELQGYVPPRPQTSIARLQEPVSSDELHRDVSTRPRASIGRLRLTANILEPASSNELQPLSRIRRRSLIIRSLSPHY
jgi:hypothetical protein